MTTRPALLAAALILSAAAAHAGVVSETITGRITGSSTTDTLGLFGKAGTDLAGRTIQVYAQYVTQLLPTHGVCRTGPTCTYQSSQQLPGTPGSVTISVAVGGKRVTYAPVYSATVFFQNNFENRLSFESDVFSGFGSGFSGATASVSYINPVRFGVTPAPGNAPVHNRNDDFVAFWVPNSTLPSETLNFVVTSP